MKSVIYLTLLNIFVEVLQAVKPKSVNLALETVFHFDKKNQNADIEFIEKVENFLGKVKNAVKGEDGRRNIKKVRILNFTDFVKNAAAILLTYNDDDLENIFAAIDEVSRKFNYKGFQFYELFENVELRRFMSEKLEQIKDTPAVKLRNQLKKLINDIHNEKYDENCKRLLDFVNSYYSEESFDNLNDVLISLQRYKNGLNRSNVELKKMISDGLTSAIFDLYSRLNSNARRSLKIRIHSYWQALNDASEEKLAGFGYHNPNLDNTNIKRNKETKEPVTVSKEPKSLMSLLSSIFSYNDDPVPNKIKTNLNKVSSDLKKESDVHKNKLTLAKSSSHKKSAENESRDVSSDDTTKGITIATKKKHLRTTQAKTLREIINELIPNKPEKKKSSKKNKKVARKKDKEYRLSSLEFQNSNYPLLTEGNKKQNTHQKSKKKYKKTRSTDHKIRITRNYERKRKNFMQAKKVLADSFERHAFKEFFSNVDLKKSAFTDHSNELILKLNKTTSNEHGIMGGGDVQVKIIRAKEDFEDKPLQKILVEHATAIDVDMARIKTKKYSQHGRYNRLKKQKVNPVKRILNNKNARKSFTVDSDEGMSIESFEAKHSKEYYVIRKSNSIRQNETNLTNSKKNINVISLIENIEKQLEEVKNRVTLDDMKNQLDESLERKKTSLYDILNFWDGTKTTDYIKKTVFSVKPTTKTSTKSTTTTNSKPKVVETTPFIVQEKPYFRSSNLSDSFENYKTSSDKLVKKISSVTTETDHITLGNKPDEEKVTAQKDNFNITDRINTDVKDNAVTAKLNVANSISNEILDEETITKSIENTSPVLFESGNTKSDDERKGGSTTETIDTDRNLTKLNMTTPSLATVVSKIDSDPFIDSMGNTVSYDYNTK